MHTLFGCALLLAGLAVASRLRADKRGLLRGAAVAFLLMSPALWMAVRAVTLTTSVQLRSCSCCGSTIRITFSRRPGADTTGSFSPWPWRPCLPYTRPDGSSEQDPADNRRTVGGKPCLSGSCCRRRSRPEPISRHSASRARLQCVDLRCGGFHGCLLHPFRARRARLGRGSRAAGLVCSVFLWRFHRLMTEPFDLMFLAMVCAVTWIVSRQKPPRPMLAPLVPAFALMLLFSVFAATTPRPAGMASLQPRLRDEIDLAEWAKRDSPLDSVFFRSTPNRGSFLAPWPVGAASSRGRRGQRSSGTNPSRGSGSSGSAC